MTVKIKVTRIKSITKFWKRIRINNSNTSNIYSVSRKKETKMFSVISSIQSMGDSDKTWYTIVLSYKETPELIPPQLWPPNSPDLNRVDYSVWDYCKIRCTKYISVTWMNWNSDWEQSRPSWITSSLRQPFVNGVVDSFRSVMRVL